jgi:hypothetical protein
LRLYLAIEIDFQRESCGIEDSAAIPALSQVALNFTRYLRSEAPFQILANKPDCGLARHAHK